MKKILSILLIFIMCFGLYSCGNTGISGDPVTYTNASKSVSIDLPGEWTANEEATPDTLDVTNGSGTANVQIQCLAKGQIEYIAKDLDAYTDYAMVNTLGDVLAGAEISEAEIAVPDFIKSSKAQNFTLKNGDNTVKGFVITMESSRCYYTVLVMAVGDVYNSNDKALMESVLSIKEIAQVPAEEATEEK